MIENAGNVPEDSATLLNKKDEEIRVLKVKIDVLEKMYDKVHTERNALKQRIENFTHGITGYIERMGS